MKYILEKVENIVGKGENSGNQHFLLFPTMFSKRLLKMVVCKSRDYSVKGEIELKIWKDQCTVIPVYPNPIGRSMVRSHFFFFPLIDSH